jgi:hypothetical protein
MRFIVQVRIEPDTDSQSDVIDIAVIERDVLSPATLGLSIEDANRALTALQQIVVTEHCAEALSTVEVCVECGRRFAHKDTRQLHVRTLYGTIAVPSPRWWTCSCSTKQRSSFTPLARLLPERFTPELGLVEAKLAAHMAFSAAGKLLGELLPVGRTVHGTKHAGTCIASAPDWMPNSMPATSTHTWMAPVTLFEHYPNRTCHSWSISMAAMCIPARRRHDATDGSRPCVGP